MIQLNKNQSQVLATLFYNNRAGRKYMTSLSIKEQCGFEKNATTTGCLMGLMNGGLVWVKTQVLLDNTIHKFFYIPDDVMEKLNSIVSFELKRE